MTSKKEQIKEFKTNNAIAANYIKRVKTLGYIGVVYSVFMFIFDTISHAENWSKILEVSVFIVSILFIVLSYIMLDKLVKKYNLQKYKDNKQKNNK